MSQEPEDVKPKLQLFVVLSESSSKEMAITVKVRPTMAFKKIFDAAYQKFDKEPGTLRFTYDGTRLGPDDTPEKFEMEDDDRIDAHLAQIGGARS